MAQIHKLDKETIAQIAAGEIIERPANVIKELIDNSIDANATEIIVEIEDSGLTKIEVIDNGIGMDRKDLLLAVLPHTTSKIATIEDLNKISTLGFRGEALASIKSVSDIVIKSRKRTLPSGTKLLIKNNNKPVVTTTGMNFGTTVTITNLFKNVPARKKFLKGKLSEIRIISEIVSDFCFAYPAIRFKLISNGRTLIDETNTQLRSRIENLLGEEIFTNLLPIKHSSSFFKASGFLGKPQIGGSSNKLLIFVNKRRVYNKLITEAVKEAYGSLLMPRTYPLGMIFIDIPPHLVDVNVHPTKREVRFSGEKEMYNEIRELVSELLEKNNLTYQNVNYISDNSLKENLRNAVAETYISKLGEVQNDEIFQIHKSYLISETPDGIQIIDQHAAHESLLYFEFLDAYEKKSQTKIELETPVVIDLTVSNELLLEEYLPDLAAIGFEIEEFGEHSYRVIRVPAVYKDQDILEVIANLLATLSENHKKLSEKEHLMLATLACKSAIKAGQTLNDDQKRDLLNALTQKNFAYTCPHGRPVKLAITLDQLARMFKRK